MRNANLPQSSFSLLNAMKQNQISTAEMLFICHFRIAPEVKEISKSEIKADETISFILKSCGFQSKSNTIAGTQYYKHPIGIMITEERGVIKFMCLNSVDNDFKKRILSMISKHSAEYIIWKKAA